MSRNPFGRSRPRLGLRPQGALIGVRAVAEATGLDGRQVAEMVRGGDGDALAAMVNAGQVYQHDRLRPLPGRQALSPISALPDWYRIENKADPVVDVYLYDEIGYFGTTAADFIKELKTLEADELVVHINSIGGDVFDGIAMYTALRTHPAVVTVKVDSIAASIASVIAQAGDRRVMVSHSQMMIHEAWGLAIGSAAEIRSFADLLERGTDLIAGIYAEASGGNKAHFLQLMANETWLSDAETVTEGLADEIWTPPAKTPPDSSPSSQTNPIDWSKIIASGGEIFFP